MKHTYTISGMTCDGCQAAVEEKLNKLDNARSATVNLEAGTATITSELELETDAMNAVRAPQYAVKAKNQMFSNRIEESSRLNQLRPLFLVFAYSIAGSVLIDRDQLETGSMMLDFMGLFYIVFAFFKLLDLRGFQQSFRMYDPIAANIPIYGFIYPYIETVLGVFFLLRFQLDFALITTLVVLGSTSYGVSKTLLNKRKTQCACLGTALKLPMTLATFIENSIMIVMVILMLLKSFTL